MHGWAGMIKPEQIPDAVITEFLACVNFRQNMIVHCAVKKACVNDEVVEYTWRECISAAINAWPGMRSLKVINSDGMRADIIIPLPQEKNDG